MARDTEYILKLIEEHGMATAQDIFAAREAALNSDDIVDPVDVLLKQGKIQENELLSMLAQQYGWEFVDLNDFDIDPSVIESLSVDIAQHYGVFPVMKHDDVITVAMSDPTDMEKLDTLLFELNSVFELKKGIDICWGDAGTGSFFIQREKLKDLDFSCVLYNYDCC